ncbi:MAG: hypothetical protein IKO03_08175 [Lachnospiraceae bacterium]|nr:hypothetical protein [Lachnospiraceae bacterium]MBR3508723.1 hypothetical protein [Lachnospiraceae bacterium]MBR4606583.1 hypothetical protein [Lachnospiraceae bacterium]MBR6149927.1 hypothetical protein [Lachnospiraceae bacterium]
MINFEEELKKFHPSTEVEDIQDCIYNHNATDIAGVFEQMFTRKEEPEQEQVIGG